MIINEKYLQDIDDEDDDGLTNQTLSSRAMADAKFEHYVRIKYLNMFETHPDNEVMLSNREDGDLTYGTFTEIYDRLDVFMDSIVSVTDYHIRITAVIHGDVNKWWISPNIPPNDDSYTDYGKMDEFDYKDENAIHNFTIEVKYNCERMTFEQFMRIVFEIRKNIKEVNTLSYTLLSF